MIDFDPTPDQEDLRILAHEFARDVIRPAAAEYDEWEETPWSVMHQAHEPGFDTYAYPEEFGGGGVTDTDDGHASTATLHLPQRFTQFSEQLSNPVYVARRSPVSRIYHDPGSYSLPNRSGCAPRIEPGANACRLPTRIGTC